MCSTDERMLRIITYDFESHKANVRFERILEEAYYPMMIRGDYLLAAIPLSAEYAVLNWSTGVKLNIFIDNKSVSSYRARFYALLTKFPQGCLDRPSHLLSSW